MNYLKPPIKTVRLRNGSEEAEPAVVAIMVSLRQLMNDNPIALFELVEVSKNASHKPFGNTGEVLKRLSLMEPDGRIHDTIRNIVLSAAEGEGLNLHLVSPVVGDK